MGRYGEGALYPLSCDNDEEGPPPSTQKTERPATKTPRRRKRLPALPPHLTREGLWAPGEEDWPVHRLRLLEPGAARKAQRQQLRQQQGQGGEEGGEEELTARPFFSPFQHWTQPHVAFPSLVLDLTTPAGGALFLRPLEEVRRSCSVGRMWVAEKYETDQITFSPPLPSPSLP